MKELKLFSPATVANVSCGFDAMGFALEGIGDEMIFKKNESGVLQITKIEGAQLPFDINKNAVGVVAQAMLKAHPVSYGIDIEIYKNFKPGSGLGSSAASASGTAFGINKLIGEPFTPLQLTEFAMIGEELTSGSQFADNVASAIYGGFVLIRGYNPLDVVSIPTPNDLFVTVIHPQIEIKTRDARDVLPKTVPLKSAITQWANVGGLIAGLCTSNYDVISRSLNDVIVEPVRKPLIPYFDDAKQAALRAGALGAGISGSGPTIFSLSKGRDIADNVAEELQNVYAKTAIDFEVYVSRISTEGVKVIPSEAGIY